MLDFMDAPELHSPSTGLRRLASATGILIAAQMLGAALQLVSLRTVQDTLTKAANGEFFWIQQVSMFVFFAMAEMGMTSVATRIVIQHAEAHDRIIATFFKLRILLWLLASVILCAFSAITSSVHLASLSAYALFSLIGARTLLLRPVLELRRRSENRQLLPALTGLLDAALFAICILSDAAMLTPLRVMIWFLVSALPGFLIMLLADQQWRSIWKESFDKTIAMTLIRESLPLLVSLLLVQIQDKSDTFALDFFHGKESLGVYAAAMRVAAQCGVLVMILPTVISPAVSALRISNQERCRLYMVEGLNITLLASIGAASGLVVLVQPIAFITAGSKYLSNVAEFSLATWTLVGSMMVAYIFAVMTAIGEQRKLYPMVWTLCLCSIALNFTLTPQFGTFGAILSKAGTTILGGCVGLMAMYSFVRNRSLVQGVVRVLVVLVMMLPCTLLVREGAQILALQFALPILVQHVIAGVSIGAVFGGMCLVTKLVSRKELALVKSMLQRS
jgi:O-antigen/teichoic acid export membrane protein